MRTALLMVLMALLSLAESRAITELRVGDPRNSWLTKPVSGRYSFIFPAGGTLRGIKLVRME